MSAGFLPLAMRVVDLGICFARKTWRPVTCFAVGLIVFFTAGAVLINGIIIPLTEKVPLDLAGLGSLLTGAAALVASLMPFVVARSWDKKNGCQDA